jgi:peptidoglycan/LPS O-acetylase OafA/YrhL
MTESPAAAPTATDGFRPDLEGLRGLAILLVLLFHAGIPGVTGGFIGVDVFYVLSGFLITGLLIRERERAGRVSLPAFYARRARRILPAALTVAVVTMVAAAAILPPLDLLRTADDAVAVALSVGNIRFAGLATDYFAPTGSPSPLLHYWSLGVEEQFYVVWPALLILATRFGRPRLGAGLVVSGVVAASLALSVWLTGVAAPWAFYSLPARAWQLGAGGLLAIALERGVRLRLRAPLVAAGWTGLAAVLGGAVVIGAGTPYPGVAALLPTVGTAALIASGGLGRWSPGRLLAIAPMRFLGRISFSLYLVHWPMLVLPAAGLSVDEELPIQARVALALASIAVAWVCWRVVEEPIHHTRRLRTRPWRTLGVAAATVAATIAVVVVMSAATSQALNAALAAVPTPTAAAPTDAANISPTPAPTPSSSPAVTPSAAPPSASATAPVATATAGITPSPSASPTTTPTPSPSPQPTPTPQPSPSPSPSAPPGSPLVFTPRPIGPPPDPAVPQPLPPDVRPALRAAAGDRERIEADGCELGNLAVQPPLCVYGDPAGSVTVALVGDSHAAQWFPAMEVIASRLHWRLLVYTKISCRFVDLPIFSRDLKREYTECEQWRELVVTELQGIRPDLVVVSAARGMAIINPGDDNAIRQGEAMARLLARVPGRHAIIVDTPQSHVVVPDCLSSHIADTRPCDSTRAVGVSPRYLLLEQTAARMDGATLINMTDILCPGTMCPAVLNGYIVFRDVFHLTATFSAALADSLQVPLQRALGG